MLKLTQRVKSLFVNPLYKLVPIMSELNELAGQLKTVKRQADPLSGLVQFFNLTSPWHDRGLREVIRDIKDRNYALRYDKVIYQLEALQTHFERAGRQPHGMNRTEPERLVTGDNVFLGGVYGTFTHPIPKWRELLAREPADCRTSCKEIIYGQAREFMASHIDSMVEIINNLGRAVNI